MDSKFVSTELNNLLSEYIAIHEEIFNRSILSSLFKKIDYKGYLNRTQNLHTHLENCSQTIFWVREYSKEVKEKEYLQLLFEYASYLLDTVKILKKILAGLNENSKSAINSNYDKEEYEKDLELYNKSIDTYTRIGERLNTLINKHELDFL